MRLMNNALRIASLTAALIAASAPAAAQSDAGEPSAFQRALAESKPLLFSRLRYERVSQDDFTENAHALTYLIRAGVETGKLWDTSLLIEFDHVQDLVGDFNSTINGKTQFPVVPDPNVTELNRFQLVNTTLPDTRVTLGRQRIIHDNARFIGNVGWRQNEQTFDALRIENKSLKGLTLDAAYIDQANRIFGDNSPMGRWDSDIFLFNGKYDLPLDGAKASVSGFAYLLDIEDAPAASSQTYGFNAGASRGPFSVKGAFAAQSDYGAQPIDYSARYYMVEGGAEKNGFSVNAGYEALTGDGAIGFSTPLATLHAFNGWADVFLATPPDGLTDLYIAAGFKKNSVGPFSQLGLSFAYHDYSAQNSDARYGAEFDIAAAAKIGKVGLLAKFASYEADAFETDRNKFWLQIEAGL